MIINKDMCVGHDGCQVENTPPLLFLRLNPFHFEYFIIKFSLSALKVCSATTHCVQISGDDYTITLSDAC